MTTENKHTPGPWSWNVRGFVGPASTEDDQSFGMICDEVAECTYSNGCKEANARLIAAAPDLLEALEMALVWLDYEGKYDVQGIRAAIAKARGQ